MVEVLYTDEFEAWWDGLTGEEQESIAHDVNILRVEGVSLRFPALLGHLQGRPYRVLYAFDSNRAAVLLIGGDKTGEKRWYEIFVPIADRLYDEHLSDLEKQNSG